jgi:two-component sensor histidine kinase
VSRDVVSLVIPARTEYLILARLALAGIARGTPIDESTLADLKLAVTEACGNAVRHAKPSEHGVVLVDLGSENIDTRLRGRLDQAATAGFFDQRGVDRLVLLDLACQLGRVAVCGQRHDSKVIAVAVEYGQRAAADRAGRAQQRNADAHRKPPPSRMTKNRNQYASGIVK